MFSPTLNGAREWLNGLLAGRQNPVVAATSAFWDKRVIDGGPSQIVYWTAHPSIREYVNEYITGVKWLWPLMALKAGWAYKPFARGLSLGCGGGELERAARLLRVCERVDGIDVSPASIKKAKLAAKKDHESGLSYRVADCDQIVLPRAKYDIVFFHGSLHHIADPDRLLDQVLNALKPHGFLYVDDYIGPSRDEWTDSHLVHAREVFAELPKELQVWPVNPPLDSTDPSEMIRSSRIWPATQERFDIIHFRPYWGNLLFPLLCAVDGVALQTPQYAELLPLLVEKERALVAANTWELPLFAVIVGRKRGWNL